MSLMDLLPWGNGADGENSDPSCVHNWEKTRTKRMATGAPASYDEEKGEFVIETAMFVMEWECTMCDETTHPSPKHGPPKLDGTEKKHKAWETESWEVGE